MKYAYEDMSDDQFEKLVVCLCQRLLGIAVQGFAKGPDGGRDAKFVGTAELHPSTASPWVGTTIIQAKHTNGYNRSFSETDFHSEGSSSTILGKEIPRIRNLRNAKQLDHYMLFSNRRLTGNTEHELVDHIASECNIPRSSIFICGIEQIEVWLKTFHDIARIVNIDPVDSPLIVSPDELAEVVQALALNKATLIAAIDDPPTPRTSYERKNTINNMTADYAKEQRKKYLKETSQIKSFLSAPQNHEMLQRYESAVDEFQLKITAKRKDHQTFDAVMEYLVDLLFNRDVILRKSGNKRLTRALLFYMYWNCDIGKHDDAATN